MAKEIKQKIVLEGEKQYSQAIKEAQRNLKTLKSELKAETAELGKNATEQQKNEVKTKSLKAQIAEQEKVVKTLKAALAEVKEKYGENADEVAKWETKLNNARTTLANMKNDLEGVGSGFSGISTDAAAATVATKSVADSLNSISSVGEAVSSTIESIFTGMVDTVKEAITAVWEDLIALADKANAWVDIAGFWNTDAATIQKWSRSVEAAHNSFDDLQNAVTRINLGDQKKIAELTGVSGENYSDNWKYAMAVMDSLSKMPYDKMLEASGAIFGEKRSTKVLDLLNDWTTIQENLSLFDVENGGIGLTEGQIQDMSTLAEQVDKLEQTWAAFLESFEAEHFGKLALDLTGNAQRILEDLIKYLDTGSDEDLAQLEKDITEFFDRIKQALEAAAGKLDEAGKKLEESDNGIVSAIGKAMQGLASALEWISKEENIDKVIHGLETLAAFWLVGKGVSLIAKIAGLAADFKVIQGFSTMSAAAGAAGEAGAAAASLGSSIASALMNVVLPVSLAAILCYPLLEKLFKGETQEEKENREKAEKAAEIGQQIREANPDMPTLTGKEALEFAMTGKTPESYSQRMQEWKERKAAEKAEAEAEAEAAQPRAYIETHGPTSPVRSARFDATEEQQEAAQAFWDVWRSGDWGENDEKYDAAWDAMEKAFEGNEDTFDRLDTWLDRIMEQYNSAQNETDYNENDWMDLPSTWWKEPLKVVDENGISSSDLEGFRGLPANIRTAAQNGVSIGVSGIKVTLDGATVGRLVAPYVSQEIARSIV